MRVLGAEESKTHGSRIFCRREATCPIVGQRSFVLRGVMFATSRRAIRSARRSAAEQCPAGRERSRERREATDEHSLCVCLIRMEVAVDGHGGGAHHREAIQKYRNGSVPRTLGFRHAPVRSVSIAHD